MKVLVLNGSPKWDKSNTYRLTSAFLDGLRQRGTNELLDEYECLSSLMWALNNQEALRPRVYSDADPRIVAQRLIALEWLLKPQLAWDDAQG